MKLNPRHPGTYTGQPARIIVAAEMSSGRLLYALRTISGHSTRSVRLRGPCSAWRPAQICSIGRRQSDLLVAG